MITTYNNLIFTHHALQRMQERRLSQKEAWEAFSYADTQATGKQGSIEFRKRMGSATVTVIAKQNERNQWIVLSCWIDPPYPGTKDYAEKQRYHAYRKAGFWGKVWMTIKSQLGF